MVFSDPAAAGQPPAKTVNGAARVNGARGGQVQYQISFANSGTAAATHVVVTDSLAPGLLYVAASLQLDGAFLSDAADGDAGEFTAGTITVRIASMAPG